MPRRPRGDRSDAPAKVSPAALGRLICDAHRNVRVPQLDSPDPSSAFWDSQRGGGENAPRKSCRAVPDGHSRLLPSGSYRIAVSKSRPLSFSVGCPLDRGRSRDAVPRAAAAGSVCVFLARAPRQATVGRCLSRVGHAAQRKTLTRRHDGRARGQRHPLARAIAASGGRPGFLPFLCRFTLVRHAQLLIPEMGTPSCTTKEPGSARVTVTTRGCTVGAFLQLPSVIQFPPGARYFSILQRLRSAAAEAPAQHPSFYKLPKPRTIARHYKFARIEPRHGARRRSKGRRPGRGNALG